MSTHTPGPWLIEPTDTSKAIVTDDCVICEMAVWAYEHQKEIEANAHLIAAAPDLLEAAIALQVAAPLGQSEWNAAADKLDKAIEKATGASSDQR